MRIFWEAVLERLVELHDPKVIVEVGSFQGANTRVLLSAGAARGRVVHSIDPRPDFDVEALQQEFGERFVPHQAPSLQALPAIDGTVDLVLIDGDHNWYTVYNELRLIESIAAKAETPLPLIVMHDLSWPYGRRDLYYAPDVIPASHRHPYEKAAMEPGRSELVAEGGLNDDQLNARHEGGEKNGVLTAVEDFLGQTSLKLELIHLPVWHGLGILYGEHHVRNNPALAELLTQLSPPPPLRRLMEAVEAKRIEYKIEAQVKLRRLQTNADQRFASLDAKRKSTIEALKQRNDSLQLALASLRERVVAAESQLSSQLEALANTRDYHQRELGALREELELAKTSGINKRLTRLLGRAVREVDRVGEAMWPRIERRFRKNAVPDKAQEPGDEARVPKRRPHPPRTVDVVVCVFNALDDVRRCLDSVLYYLAGGTRIIVVNDASDAPTSEYLQEFAADHSDDVVLIEHPSNRGYTRSVNTGLNASTADYVILLNSDTIVTPGWIERIVACGESDEAIGIIGPLSNAASWQNVPDLLDEQGTFAINELPEGHSPASFAGLVAAASARAYPRVPFINGFCYAIKRAVLDAIGEFDAEAFPRGYGEENDYSIRAAEAGFALAVADDAYVYHAKSKSFGHTDRAKLSEAGKHALEGKHGVDKVKALVRQVKASTELADVRAAVVAATKSSGPSERILFVLPVAGGGGGAHSVVQEVTAMRRFGVEARIAIPARHVKNFFRNYDAIPERHSMFVPFQPDELVAVAAGCTVVVATVYTSMAMVRQICAAHPTVVPAYYVQDYEPLFFAEGTDEHQEALDSYTMVPDTILFAKTQWLVNIVKERHGLHVHKVSPSLDHDVYRPNPHKPKSDRVRVCAMIRPKTPRRGARRTMSVLGRVQDRHADKVDVHIFGCNDDDPLFKEIADLASYENHGILDREGVSAVLADSDVFIDLSSYQAFGRTGLEAMACGCAVINPVLGGADEYSVHEGNSLLVDTSDEDACVDALERLVVDDELRERMAAKAVETARAYSKQRAAATELKVLRDAWQARLAAPPRNAMRVKALIARTKGGTPTGSAYVRVIVPHEHRASSDSFLYHSATAEDFLADSVYDGCDVLLVQRDGAGHIDRARQVVDKCRSRGIRIVYEVDDLLIDAALLKARGYTGDAIKLAEASRFLAVNADAVIVSTEPLAAAYRELNERVVILPNALDERLWGLGKTRPDGAHEKRPTDPIRIGYIGTQSHAQDLELLHPVLKRLADELGKKINIEVIGGYSPGQRAPKYIRQIGLPRDHSYPSFVDWVRLRCNWDIGLIPLVDDEFNRAKSYVKWLEYSALGLASVCTDIAPYREVVRTGHNGLMVPNTDDAWYDAIKSLIEDASLRNRLAAQALWDVQEKHTLSAIAAERVALFESLWDEPERRASIVGLAGARVEAERARKRTGEVWELPSAPVETSEQQVNGYQRFKRRFRKLRNDPRKFLIDSRFGVVRKLGRTVTHDS